MTENEENKKENGDEKKKLILKKLQYYFKYQLPVHFELIDRSFLNGNIVEFHLDDEVIVINELKLGVSRVFLDEIFDVDEFHHQPRDKDQISRYQP